jgi:acetyl esterase/lipase
MRAVKWILVAVALLAASVVIGVLIFIDQSESTTANQQNVLAQFYEPPSPMPQELGTVVRMEPLGVDVPGGTGYRMLYVSQRPDGERAVSGGMLFIPSTPAPAGGRPVVAWAHGTLGMGDACTPSRSTNPLQDTDNWLGEMLDLGWIVVSTDYVGMGTPGPNLYLVAQAEVRDVVNSVRAARNVPEAHASNRFIAWGHSQGGHSSLWTGHLAKSLAPELDLIAVAAAAPAAELNSIIGAQWKTPVGWVIGPEVEQSWPVVYPNLHGVAVVTARGLANSERIANECIAVAGLEALA